MSNHTNRPRYQAGVPDPEEIRAARQTSGLTQAQAAELIYSSAQAWKQWETGRNRMHPAFWRLFKLLAKPKLAPL
jgi:DNA-binding transcriptional regulator YiaG